MMQESNGDQSMKCICQAKFGHQCHRSEGNPSSASTPFYHPCDQSSGTSYPGERGFVESTRYDSPEFGTEVEQKVVVEEVVVVRRLMKPLL
jgi:hypothetical protein